MWIKVLGGLLVFISCTMLGAYYALKDGFRADDLSELKQALLMLKNEIEFTRNALPEAMGNVAGRLEPRLSRFFRHVETRLLARSGEEAALIWREALSEKLGDAYFQQEDLDCLSRLGEILGYLDKRMQAEGVDMAISYIDGKLAELRDVSAKNRRLYGSVGVVGGLLLTIVLL